MGVILKNNVTSTITTAISASDVGLAVAAGTGSLFPTLGAGDYFYATLVSSGGTYEVIKVTARVGDTMTIARAQEGTVAQSFASGSRIELRVTAQGIVDLVRFEADASPVVLTDIAALRAVTWAYDRPALVQLISDNTLGDGGSQWRWDATSTAVEGLNVVKEAATATGRWLRQMPEIDRVPAPTLATLPVSPPITLSWLTAQFLASGATTLLTPQGWTGGSGDEGYQVITGDGIRSGFDSMSGLVLANVRAYASDGSAVAVSSVTTAPPRVVLGVTPAAGAKVTVVRSVGQVTCSERWLGARVTIRLVHGTVLAAGQIIEAFVRRNGTVEGVVGGLFDPAAQVITEGTVVLPSAQPGDVIDVQVTHANFSASVLGIQAGSTITIEPLADASIENPRLVGSIHQGAPLTDADIPHLAETDVLFVSGMWSGMIADSGTVVKGHTFWDGFLSGAHTGLYDRLNAARQQRAAVALPGGPAYLAYMTATVAAPDGSLAGQAIFDRFSGVTAGQTTFTATRDVFFVATTGGFFASAWVAYVTAGGNRSFGYGKVFTLVGGGYETTDIAFGVTATIRFSGVGFRTCTITLSEPLLGGDYFTIAHAANRDSLPWEITDEGRQNVREMIAVTWGDVRTQFDGVFLDLCSPQFISRASLAEVVSIIRPFAPKLCLNVLVAGPESVEFGASVPSLVSGDMLLIEGAGVAAGVTKVPETLAAVAERDRIADGGKALSLVWLATIANADPGPVETHPQILAARDLFLANSRPGDVFMAHWAGLGTPNLGVPRPLPGRVPGVISWGSS